MGAVGVGCGVGAIQVPGTGVLGCVPVFVCGVRVVVVGIHGVNSDMPGVSVMGLMQPITNDDLHGDDLFWG